MRHRRPLAALIATALLGVAPLTATAATPEAAHWTFDEGAGTTATDSAGTHPATLTGGAGWTKGVRGGALSTDGVSGYADAGAGVVDTTQSFSVSSWVKLSKITGYQTVVSVDGNQVSNFYLQFRDDSKRFAFTRLSADTPADGVVASANFDPVANQWYLLTGVYDATAKTLALYVDGTKQSTVTAPPAWSTTGHLVIGRGKYAGNPVDFVSGAIDDVRVNSGALTPAEISRLATAGNWRLDEGTGTSAVDSASGYTATLTGGVTWADGIVGSHAVTLDGTDGALDVNAPVIDTGESFTVAAWVKPTAATGFRTAVSVDGTNISGFFLQKASDGRFAFTRRSSDGDTASATAESTQPAQTDQWQHIAGVYNRAAGTLSLYVNGTLQQSVPFTSPWTANGHFVIGRGKFSGGPVDFFAGGIDDVRAYPTPLASSAIADLAASGSWHFDGTAEDSSPNAIDGTVHNGTWGQGAAGKAIQFVGNGDVTMGASPTFDTGTGSFSLAAWLRTTSNGQIVSHGNGYTLGVANGKLTARIGGKIDVTTTGGRLADGNWHHTALVLDRATQRLTIYIDGDPAALTSAGCGTIATLALDVTSCPADGSSPAPFVVGSGLTGAVDEVEFRRFALTSDQVGTLAGANQLSVDANVPRANTRTTTYGSILEDISHSVEGGLYAELVRNRAFKEAGSGVPYWTLVPSGGAAGTFAIDPTTPLNTAIDRSLKLHVDQLPPGARLAAANEGFYGVPAKPSTRYTGSLFVKAASRWSTIRVSLEKPDGTVLASKDIRDIGSTWKQRAFEFTTPPNITPSSDNRIVVSLLNPGRTAITGQDVWITQVSVFPPTFKNHGVRQDLGEKLAALKLGLFRIPGGNYLEGNTLDTRFAWKNTIGPVEQRPGHQNTAWGYWSTDGFGIHEYLQLAEDIGAQPLLALFAGYTLNGQHVPQDQYGTYVQEALDEIEYAIGDPSTTWGAKRAAAGHPAPFNLRYVEVGNEDWFDNSGSYAWRFTDMYKAIKAKFPQLTVVSTTAPDKSGVRPDAVDDHFYQSPQWFVDNSTRYDRADRGGPEVLVGEYGAQDGRPTGTLAAAVGEAAFLTGLERNSDTVIGSMYAPVLVNENQPNWPVNLIGFDTTTSYGSPSYWVQQMFANNLGKQVVLTRLNEGSPLREVVTMTTSGSRKTFYVKIVNPTGQVQSTRLSLTGVTSVDGTGTLTVLTGDPTAHNTLAAPNSVVPQTKQVNGLAATTKLTLPANSVSVLVVTGR